MSQTEHTDTLTEDDKALLTDYLDPLNSIFDLARMHERRIADIAAWANEPRIAAALDQLAELSERRARTIASTNADTAARTLADVATDPTASPETRRRAATALRASAPAADKPVTRTNNPATKLPSRREGLGVGSKPERQRANSSLHSRRSKTRRGGEGQGEGPDVGSPKLEAHFPPFIFITDLEHFPQSAGNPIRRRAP